MFETATGKEVARLADQGQGPVFSVAFSLDGRRLAIASANEVLITPSPDDISDYVCAHLPFNLTADEWKEYLPNEPYRETCPNFP